MTAEERLAYFQGEKRRTVSYTAENGKTNRNFIALKLKFFIAVILFVLFLSLDYTGYQIRGIGSGELIQMVTTDFEFPEQLSL